MHSESGKAGACKQTWISRGETMRDNGNGVNAWKHGLINIYSGGGWA
jgi:hypothetical protein